MKKIHPAIRTNLTVTPALIIPKCPRCGMTVDPVGTRCPRCFHPLIIAKQCGGNCKHCGKHD